MAHVHQINVNPKGGVPKLAVASAELWTGGVRGDLQRNLKYHGGPERAVCLLGLEIIEALRAQGHPIAPGSTGENLTVAGVDWTALALGTRLRVGKAMIEITAYTTPCRNIAASFADGDSNHICQKKNPGRSRVYARVIAAATVFVNDPIEILEGDEVLEGGQPWLPGISKPTSSSVAG